MQLGSRWRYGDTPHPGVPEALHSAIANAEASHVSGSSWTLTWLEGRARVELLADDGSVLADLSIDAHGRVVAKNSPAGGAQLGGSTDEDDDDWLAE